MQNHRPLEMTSQDFLDILPCPAPDQAHLQTQVFSRSLELENLKMQFSKFGSHRLHQVRDLFTVNKFGGFSNSRFMNRAAIKLAELDFLCKLLPSETNEFFFCDVCGGPGGFTEFLQWRNPAARGVGITLREKLDWTRKRLDLTRFRLIYGGAGDGDLFGSWQDFSHFVWSQSNNVGADLVLADGGFEVTDPSQQELLSISLLMLELLTAIKVLRIGGTLVLKVFSTVLPKSLALLKVAATVFGSIEFVKPWTSRPANSERYLVGKNFRGAASPETEKLRHLQTLDEFEKEGAALPDWVSLMQWWGLENLMSISMEHEACLRLLEALERNQVQEEEEEEATVALEETWFATWRIPSLRKPRPRTRQPREPEGYSPTRPAMMGQAENRPKFCESLSKTNHAICFHEEIRRDRRRLDRSPLRRGPDQDRNRARGRDWTGARGSGGGRRRGRWG